MKFSYVEFRGKLVPMLPIKFKHKEDWLSLDGYLDSGAGYSIFHQYVTDILELRLEDGKKVYVTVGDGSQIPAYIHLVTVSFGDKVFEARIGFSRRLGIGFNIIGRLDIFDRFKICFDEKERFVELFPK